MALENHSDFNLLGNVSIDGDGNRDFTVGRRTTGTGVSYTLKSGGAQSGGTNLSGGNLVLSSGISTGNTRSNIQFQVPTQGGSGSSDNSPSTQAILFSASSNLPIFAIGNAGGSTTGTPFNNAFLINGNGAGGFGAYRNTSGAGNTVTLQSAGAQSSGTNLAGGALILSSGISTGSGASQIRLQGYLNNAASTTDNTAVNRVILNGIVTLTDNVAATLITIPLATLQMAGGILVYSVDASDGTDMINDSGSVYFSAVNKAGTYTTNASLIGTDSQAKSEVTDVMTVSFSFLDGSNQTSLQITVDVTNITPTTFRVTYAVISGAFQSITAP